MGPLTAHVHSPVLGRLRRNRLALAGAVLVLVFLFAAVGAPLLAPHDPAAAEAARRLQAPSLAHLLGTDHLGRDILSRLLYGARWSLGTSVFAMAVIVAIGVAVGTIAGYFGGLVDGLLMRVVDVVLAFPALILALALAGTLGPGLGSIVLALICVWWAGYARMVRGLVLSLRERHFVEAARALGLSHARIMLRHLLPNILSPVLVLATLEIGELILVLAALNFLGLGVEPPAPEWGVMINDARPYLLTAPRLMFYPGAAISLLVIGFNLLGDGLRDAMDPHMIPEPRAREVQSSRA
jgi:peptide/nickel transport system permease protein